MRAELEVVHSAEQFWVNSHDNSKIDCVIIPSAVYRTAEEQSSFLNAASNRGPISAAGAPNLPDQSDFNSSRSRAAPNDQSPYQKLQIDNKQTNFVLFFNPNAVFYEFMNYQTEWMYFYQHVVGLNIIVFNYRGYGRSDMSSSKKFWQKYLGLMNP